MRVLAQKRIPPGGQKDVFDDIGGAFESALKNTEDLFLHGDYSTENLLGTIPGYNMLAGGGKSSGNVFAPSGYEYIGPYEMPALPELTPYTGPTWAPVPRGFRDVEAAILKPVNDPNSNYNKVISGDPNWELFNKYVEAPMQQKLTAQTLPQIASVYGSTPYGGSVYSGAREEKQAQAITDAYNKLGELRLAYGDEATKNMLNAMGLLPSFANVFAQEQGMTANNLNRKINTHFQNEQLKIMEFDAAMKQLGVEIGVDQFNVATDLEYQQLNYAADQAEQAQQAQLWSTIGAIGGGAIGLLSGGPTGAMVGSTIGGQVGNLFGGGRGSASGVTSTFSSLALLEAMKSTPSVASTPTTVTKSIYEDPLRMNDSVAAAFSPFPAGSQEAAYSSAGLDAILASYE